jgi:DNA-binding response OmpR family regulator
MARARTRQRIFVIDDDEELASMLGEMLRGMGYFSVVCTKPLNALTLFSRAPGRFDAVIVDEMMPDLRGTELAVQFLRVKASIPIILMTGRGDMISMEQARESGVRTILIKPVLTERLRVVLAGLLKKAKQGL